MNFESSTVAVDELSYYANKGYTIKVAAVGLLNDNEGVKLYNEKYKFYDVISGHAMTFKGFNENGDMILNTYDT